MQMKMDSKTKQLLEDSANRFRINSIKATNASNSGHPTSCASAAEIMSVLFFHAMRYTVEEPLSPSSDRFVLSKGHAAPVLYAAWAEAGLFPESELLNFRKIDSNFDGHPTPRLNFVDIATGSLGQGLSCAAGMAYTGKYFDKADYRVYCLIGDGESAEGSIWEALSFSSHYKLDNLVAIFDINRLGQTEPTSLQHDINVYQQRLKAFGWNVYITDGHSVEDLASAFDKASTVKDRPSCILAKTFKGKGFLDVEDHLNWHGKPLGTKAEAIISYLESLIQSSDKPSPKAPQHTVPAVDITNIKLSSPPAYKIGEQITNRAAYGTALAKLGDTNSRVIALDGDTKDSTYSKTFEDSHPDRFIECFIAEQNLVGVAIGCAIRNRTVAFASIFAAFFSRAYDHIRMGAISYTNVNFVGSHSGISIGPDGACEMALEDLAMFRAIPGCTVFYPSDAVSCERAVELAANQKGICYIRTTRPTMSTIYPNEEIFRIGEAKIIRQSADDKVTVIAAGITLHEAIEAAEVLAASGINIRIIDPFTIKPMDGSLILKSARQTGGKIITVEDHYPEGGLGDAVSSCVDEEEHITVKRMAVKDIPRSGQTKELLDMFGISASCIIQAVKQMTDKS